MTVNENIIHKPLWSSAELEIVYLWYDKKTIAEIKEMLPNRTFSAVKNKVKQIKFGKYKKKPRCRYCNAIIEDKRIAKYWCGSYYCDNECLFEYEREMEEKE